MARLSDLTAPKVEGVVLTRVSSLSGYDIASTVEGWIGVCRLRANTQKMRKKEEMANSIGIDIGKKKCSAAIRNNESGEILEEMVLARDRQGMMSLIQRIEELGQPCRAVVESTSNMWIMVHDTLEENGIDTILAHPFKTRIIA